MYEFPIADFSIIISPPEESNRRNFSDHLLTVALPSVNISFPNSLYPLGHIQQNPIWDEASLKD